MDRFIPQITGFWTEEKYLLREESSPIRHEYRRGRIVDMAGGTESHADIAANLIFGLKSRLKGTGCKAYGSDLKVRISRSREYCYPDVTVACEPLEFYRPPARTTLLNPRVLIEVTSPGTEADDRGDKFTEYRSIPSVREYLLVSSIRRQVESFDRQPDGTWVIGAAVTAGDAIVKIASLEIEISLDEIYSGVVLAGSDRPQTTETQAFPPD